MTRCSSGTARSRRRRTSSMHGCMRQAGISTQYPSIAEKKDMTAGRRIVFFGVGLPSTREMVVANLPEGFELVFGEANPDRTLTEQAFAAAPGADYLVFWTAEAPTRLLEAATRAKLILN